MTKPTERGASRAHPKDHVAACAPYSGATYFVLYLIAETAGHGLAFFGSIDNIAKRAHINRDSARRAFRQLEADGWIECVQKSVGRSPSRYRLVLKPADTTRVEPADLVGVNPRISSGSAERQPADLVVQPADLDAQPADLVVQPADLTGLTKEPSNPTTTTERGSRTYVPAIPDRPGIIQSAPDLERFARSILSDELPEWTYTERPHVAARAAARWLDILAGAAEPAAALASVEPTLRWAAHQPYWAGRVTTIDSIAKHWPQLVVEANAKANRTPPVSKSLSQSLDSIAQAMGAA